MAYRFYIAGVELPITPGKLKVKVPGRNKVVTLIDQGDINIIKHPGLQEISFDCLLPSRHYPFANSPLWSPPSYYLDLFNDLKDSKKAFQFIVTRPLEDGRVLHSTSLRVSLEDFETDEDAATLGMDVSVALSLKRYRDYGTKTLLLSSEKARIVRVRETDGAPSGSTYTVQPGDTMFTIAKAVYNDGDRWSDLYEANRDVVGDDPNQLYSGLVISTL